MTRPTDVNDLFTGQTVLHSVPVTVSRMGRLWTLTYTCPDCHKPHTHSGGDGPRPVYGVRYRNCPKGPANIRLLSA